VRWKKSKKNKRSVDAFSVFRLQTMFHTSNSTSPPLMKKKSTSQSAFFNLRVLIGLFVALTGVSLALLATANPSGLTFGASSHASTDQAQQKYKVTTRPSIDPLVPAMFDCSKIHELGSTSRRISVPEQS
jgi:hypothetical protein